MSICRVWLHNTSNALMFQMSSKWIRLQVSPKLFGVNSSIAQIIRQWIPDCWPSDRKCTGSKSAAANSWNWQLMTSGRSQIVATRNFGDWHTVGRSRSFSPQGAIALHLLRSYFLTSTHVNCSASSTIIALLTKIINFKLHDATDMASST